MSTQPIPTLRRLATSLAPLLLVGVLATACGEDPEPAPEPVADPAAGSSSEPAAEPTAEEDAPEVVEVTLQDGVYTPLGERVEVGAGEPVLVRVTADEPGSLHVHATPEQEIVFEAGTSEHEVTIDRPGVVEVESHDPTFVLVQLEVR